jgi:hypothetical protein
MKPQKFEPDALLKSCALNVFVAMARVQLVQPIVYEYRRKILESKPWPVHADFAAEYGERVLDPESDYLMDPALFEEYAALCREARDAAGLQTVMPLACPLSEAKSNVVLSKTALISAMRGRVPVDVDKILEAPVRMQDQFVELTLKLLAPYVNSEEALTS